MKMANLDRLKRMLADDLKVLREARGCSVSKTWPTRSKWSDLSIPAMPDRSARHSMMQRRSPQSTRSF
jgi:hypothetical protein